MKINIIARFEKVYSYLPSLSTELSEFIVRVIPYLAFITGFLITLASIMEILGTPFISVLTLGGSKLIQTLFLTNAIGIAQGILMISAFRALRIRNQKGWRLLFWSQILWIISSAVSFSPSFLLALIFFYPLFQIKPYYK